MGRKKQQQNEKSEQSRNAAVNGSVCCSQIQFKCHAVATQRERETEREHERARMWCLTVPADGVTVYDSQPRRQGCIQNWGIHHRPNV